MLHTSTRDSCYGGRAVKDDYIINGSKVFITNGWLCDVVIVVAVTNPQAKSPAHSISLFLVEDGMKGFDKGKRLKKMGQKSQVCGFDRRKAYHDDVIKWKHFPRYWLFVRGILQSLVDSPHKGYRRGALIFSLICPWTNGWANNRDAGDLRRHQTHCDVIVMYFPDTSELLVEDVHVPKSAMLGEENKGFYYLMSELPQERLCIANIDAAAAEWMFEETRAYAVYSGADQRKHQSSASLAFVQGIQRWPVNSPHKWLVTRKMFPFDDVIMWYRGGMIAHVILMEKYGLGRGLKWHISTL